MKPIHIILMLALMGLVSADLATPNTDFTCPVHRLYKLDLSEILPFVDATMNETRLTSAGQPDTVNYWYEIRFESPEGAGLLSSDKNIQTCGAVGKYAYFYDTGVIGFGSNTPIIIPTFHFGSTTSDYCFINSTSRLEGYASVFGTIFASEAEKRFNIGEFLYIGVYDGSEWDYESDTDSGLWNNMEVWGEYYRRYYGDSVYDNCSYTDFLPWPISLPMGVESQKNYYIELCEDYEYKICLNRYAKSNGDKTPLKCVICKTQKECNTGTHAAGGEGSPLYDALFNCRVVEKTLPPQQKFDLGKAGAEKDNLNDFMTNPIGTILSIGGNSILAVVGFITPSLPHFEACYDTYVDDGGVSDFAICLATTLIGWFIITIVQIIFYYYMLMTVINRWSRAFMDSDKSGDNSLWVYLIFIIFVVALFVLYGVNIFNWFKGLMV